MTLGKHHLAEPEVPGKIAIAVQQPMPETDRNDHCPDHEDDVEQ
jgi:hypothetical protein